MGSTFNSFLRENTAFAGVLGRLYGFWVPHSGPESPQIVSSLRATVEPGAHMDPSGVVDPND